MQTCRRPLASAASEPGRSLQVDGRPLGGRGRTRIGDDELPAVGPLRREVLHQRRHRLAGIAAGEQHRACARDVLERERQPAVEPEGADRGRRAGGHAEPAVVVDVRGLQARRGRTCRGGRPFRWSARRCRTRRRRRGRARLHGANTAGDEVERPIPRRRAQRAAGVADERRGETVGMRRASRPHASL